MPTAKVSTTTNLVAMSQLPAPLNFSPVPALGESVADRVFCFLKAAVNASTASCTEAGATPSFSATCWPRPGKSSRNSLPPWPGTAGA